MYYLMSVRDLHPFETDGILRSMIPALLDTGFVEYQVAYIRFTIPHSTSREQALTQVSSTAPELREAFYSMVALELERHCSPLIIPDTRQAFMVPIRPGYAMSLFDKHQARQDLFGGNTTVLFRWENVYYRKATHVRLIQAPGRIFWYVSSPRKTVVAISHLDSVQVDTPKLLFRTFEKFGILDWKAIYEMCEGDTSKNVMAMKFSYTFLLRHAISLSELSA